MRGLYAATPDDRSPSPRSRPAGGRSLPSPVVGAAVAPSGEASVLVVGGFDRLDAGLLATEDLSDYALAVVQRMWLRRMNDGSYASRHGLAIADAGFSFDGATDDAIELGDVEIAGYAAIDWFAGEDSVGDLPLAPIVRDALTDYLDGGGRLLVSGSELGWALDLNGAPDEQAFYRERLHATYVSDDAETYDVAATAGPFAGLAALSFADAESYDPRYPDVLAPAPDAAIALAYGATTDVGAAIAWGAGQDGERGIVLGFPFETIAGADARRDVMAAALAFFDVVEEPGGDDDGGEDDSTAGDDDGTSGDASDATASATAGDGTGDSTGAPADGESDGGCGCTTNTSPRASAWLLLAFAALRRRRR